MPEIEADLDDRKDPLVSALASVVVALSIYARQEDWDWRPEVDASILQVWLLPSKTASLQQRVIWFAGLPQSCPFRSDQEDRPEPGERSSNTRCV